jgi:uncharacterized membrane protein
MVLYRYLYFRIYTLFEKLKSSNAHNLSLGMMSVLIVLLIYKGHAFFIKFRTGRELSYEEVERPYIGLLFIIYALNYLILEHNSKYLATEARFQEDKRSKIYNFILVGLIVFIIAIFILL